MHRPQTPQPGFGSITLLQKFTPPPRFKILDPRLNVLNQLAYLLLVGIVKVLMNEFFYYFIRKSFQNSKD